MLLDRYLARQFFPVFFVAVSMFMLLVSLIDLLGNLVRYLNYEVPLNQILLVSLYYLPKSLSYALPLSSLFAAAYILGELYARNELTSIFSAGIPFWRFCQPLILIGLMVSLLSFFFEDRIVIPTFKMKTDLSRQLLHQPRTASNSDIVIKARNGRLIYSVDYYDDDSTSLIGVSIIEQTTEGSFLALIRAPQAVWTGDYWSLLNALRYAWEDGVLRVRPLIDYREYREPPDVFHRSAVEVESLPAFEAALLVQDLRRAGLPFTGAQADYYRRFSFASTSLVVMLLSVSMGGRFKKNILLMSLLTSLSSAVGYYVTEMITMMMARLGYIPPVVGAWFPVMLFILLGFVLLRWAKT